MLVTSTLLLGLIALPEMAAHHGRVDGERGVWRIAVAGDLQRGAPLAFAASLPVDTTIESQEMNSDLLRGADGRVVALVPRSPSRLLTVELWVPRVDGVMEMPLFAGPVSQRVSIDRRDARFVPDPTVGLEAHVGYSATPAVGAAVRERIDEVCGAHVPAPGPSAMYLDGARPLRGAWVPPGVPPTVALAIAVVFAGLVAALVAAHRRLARRAEAERADSLLAQELGGL